MTEFADRKFQWTPERRLLSARAAVLTKLVRQDKIEGEDALLLTIFPPKNNERFDALVAEELEHVPMTRRASPRGRKSEEKVKADHREREQDRYHNDEEYHERRLAQFRARRLDPEWRARDNERKRKARAAAKEARA